MYRQFCDYVKKEGLFDGRRRFLIALSGGVDSVVLAHLMARFVTERKEDAAENGEEAGFGWEVGLVHCNFQLRGEESERDERFVRELAEKMGNSLGWKLFAERFDTFGYAREKGISVEMAARELRYGLFARLMEEENYDVCLLAHHADDNAETFFINLFRGSGVKGLRGMLPCSGKKGVYVRPLLFARRIGILEYARKNGLDFVEDSTNRQEIYLRNRIRHSVLPLLDEVCAGFTSKLAQSMATLRSVDSLLDEWYERQVEKCVRPAGNANKEGGSSDFLRKKGLDGYRIIAQETLGVADLETLGRHRDLFWELYLRERSFNRKQISQILENESDGESGRFFENVDRTVLLLREPLLWRCLFLTRSDFGRTEDRGIPSPEFQAPSCRQYPLEIFSREQIDKSPRKAYMAYDKLVFPLVWRHWKEGDRFKPLGTKGFKKLSDFFKDARIGEMERDSVWLLCSGKDIVWVAGYRLDDRYKLDFETGSSSRACKAWVVEVD